MIFGTSFFGNPMDFNVKPTVVTVPRSSALAAKYTF